MIIHVACCFTNIGKNLPKVITTGQHTNCHCTSQYIFSVRFDMSYKKIFFSICVANSYLNINISFDEILMMNKFRKFSMVSRLQSCHQLSKKTTEARKLGKSCVLCFPSFPIRRLIIINGRRKKQRFEDWRRIAYCVSVPPSSNDLLSLTEGWLVGMLVVWVLWRINPCRSFNTKFCPYIYTYSTKDFKRNT